jgi:hypothetical protein
VEHEAFRVDVRVVGELFAAELVEDLLRPADLERVEAGQREEQVAQRRRVQHAASRTTSTPGRRSAIGNAGGDVGLGDGPGGGEPFAPAGPVGEDVCRPQAPVGPTRWAGSLPSSMRRTM